MYCAARQNGQAAAQPGSIAPCYIRMMRRRYILTAVFYYFKVRNGAGETNHRWKCTTGFSATEDGESYEGAHCRERRTHSVASWKIEGRSYARRYSNGSPVVLQWRTVAENLLRLSVLHNRQGAKRWDQIQATCSNVRTTTMQQLKYKTCKKIKTQDETILLPSYVFFEASSSMEPSIEFPTQNVIRILSVEKVSGNCWDVDWYWRPARLQKMEHYGSLLLIQRVILADYFISTNRPESTFVHEGRYMPQKHMCDLHACVKIHSQPNKERKA